MRSTHGFIRPIASFGRHVAWPSPLDYCLARMHAAQPKIRTTSWPSGPGQSPGCSSCDGMPARSVSLSVAGLSAWSRAPLTLKRLQISIF